MSVRTVTEKSGRRLLLSKAPPWHLLKVVRTMKSRKSTLHCMSCFEKSGRVHCLCSWCCSRRDKPDWCVMRSLTDEKRRYKKSFFITRHKPWRCSSTTSTGKRWVGIWLVWNKIMKVETQTSTVHKRMTSLSHYRRIAWDDDGLEWMQTTSPLHHVGRSK